MEYKLVPWNLDYLNDLAYHANNMNIACNLRDGFKHPYTTEDAKEFITDCMEKGDTKGISRAIVVENEAIGSIGIFLGDDVYRKTAELGYWLAEEYWNKGITTKAIKELCEAAFETFDIVRIAAEPFAYNMPSRHVLEKSGFKLEGVKLKSVFKNGTVHDSCIYALTK